MAQLSERAVQLVFDRMAVGASLPEAVAGVADQLDREEARAPVDETPKRCELCEGYGVHDCPQLTLDEGWYFDPMLAHRNRRHLSVIEGQT